MKLLQTQLGLWSGLICAIALVTSCVQSNSAIVDKETRSTPMGPHMAPLTNATIVTYTDLFEQAYIGTPDETGSDIQDVNLVEDPEEPIVLAYNEADQIFDFGALTVNSNHSYILHYMLLDDGNGKSYFTYAITKGYIDSTDGVNVSQELNDDVYGYYLKKVTDGVTLESISNQNELEGLTASYRTKVKTRDTYPDTQYYSGDKIPHSCLYSAVEVYYFYKENPNMSQLELEFGATAIPLHLDHNKYYVQTPILIWKDSTGGRRLNNSTDHSKPYMDKALDVGHMCPPNC